jgi:hypothetical protein
MFGLFYGDSFESGGRMGELFAIVVWFMILQHVPRCALLALGASRGVAAMALWNAILTVVGIIGGWSLGYLARTEGSLTGAILGNALGNVAGCWVGWRALHARGIAVGREMSAYSLLFLALLGLGVGLSAEAVHLGWLGPSQASLAATFVLSAPCAAWVWRATITPLRARRGAA